MSENTNERLDRYTEAIDRRPECEHERQARDDHGVYVGCSACDACAVMALADGEQAALRAERDRARSRAATLEARLAEAEATLWDHPDCIGECACAKNAVDAVLNPKGDA